MFRETIRQITGWLRRAITQPIQELNRWQRAARYAYDLGRHGARQLREDRAPQMAAALSFRTLFGLAPVLVVATILIKAIKGSDAIVRSLHQALVAAGLDQIRVSQASDEQGNAIGASVTLATWMEDITVQLVNMNLSAIGWIGFVVIVYAAIGLMVTIENVFNLIYRAPNGRRWTRRVPLYWFILTVSPVFVVLATYVNGQFTDWIQSVHTWHWLLLTAQSLWSFGLAWIFIFSIYALVPNSTVDLRPAIIGALVATILLAIGKHTLSAYLGNAFAINQLYGSLGLVPLFMFWVYLMWLAVLFGLQVGATLQMLQGKSPNEIEHPQERTFQFDPASVLTLMEIVAENFASGSPTTYRQVANITALPESTISKIVERLVREGWLHHVEGLETAVSLSRLPANMNASKFIAIGFQMSDEGRVGRSSALIQQLRQAQQTVAEGITLATLVSVDSKKVVEH